MLAEKNQNKHSALNSSFNSLSKWHEPDIRLKPKFSLKILISRHFTQLSHNIKFVFDIESLYFCYHQQNMFVTEEKEIVPKEI